MHENGVTAVDLSVVIVNHNHRPVIETCFTSLYSLPDRATFEVSLIDNACTDGTVDWVSARYPQVVIRRNPTARGFAVNANAGMRAVNRGRYALLLNPDVTAIPGLLDRLVAFMDEHPQAGIAAPQLFNDDGTIQPNCRRFPTPLALALRALRADEVEDSARAALLDGRRAAWRRRSGLGHGSLAGSSPRGHRCRGRAR